MKSHHPEQGSPTSLPYEALLFDFDGVLADTEPLHHASWNAVLKPFGIQYTWEEYLKECVGVADPLVAQRLGVPSACVAQKQALLRQGLADSPPFWPETLRLIGRLSETYRLAVVSSSFEREIGPVLRSSVMFPCFEVLVFGNDVKNLKPAPDPYLLALERLGVRRALVIEDSDSGVASGRAAGLEVLRVASARDMPGDLLAHLGYA